MGLAKTTLMLGIYAAATNLRLIRRWKPDYGQPEQWDAATQPDHRAEVLAPVDDGGLRPTG
jgi:hypothetical protein